MATHDYVLANQSGSSFRSDLNNALAAIVSQNSNATEPATTYAYQYWVDTSATPALVKQRNAANDAWVTLAEVDGQTLAADGTTAKPGISFAADINCGLRRNAADDISIITGGTQAITVDSSQNVGIGTTSPSSALHLSSSAPVVTITDTDTNAIHTINADSSGANVSFNVDTTEVGDTDSKSSFIVNTHGEERLRVQGGTGNVGIGTNTPQSKLDVSGTCDATKFRGNDGTAADPSICPGIDNDTGMYRPSSNVIGFATTGSERARIDSSGRFLIGTTDVNPVNNNELGLAIRVEGHTIQNVKSNNLYNTFRRNTDGSTHRFYRNSTTHVGSISVTSSATAFNTSSDYRLKENIVDLNGAIARVKQLAPKRFNFIVNPDATVDGFLAHEAQAVVPEAVTGTHDGLEVWTEGEELPDGVSVGDNKLDDDGNTIPDYQGIDQSKLVPLLTAALQEAIAKIETLETKVAALEAAN